MEKQVAVKEDFGANVYTSGDNRGRPTVNP
jgi:hypothetical protein